MHTLYSLVQTADPQKQALYIKGGQKTTDGLVRLKHGETADFTTYFNSFSLKKWKRYTGLWTLRLTLEVEGTFTISYTVLSEEGTMRGFSESCATGTYTKTFSQEEMEGDILGFRLVCTSEKGTVTGGAWQGESGNWKDVSIGISITTFKREAYVKKTIAAIRHFQKSSPWLTLLVVDNGSTLPEAQEDGYTLLHNRNYGGSGGFTRGMIHYVDEGKVDYVLLMDDDIVLEPSSLERTHSLLCALREEYRDSFLAGAMLTIENPVIQYENTAYWNRIISTVMDHRVDLSDSNNLAENGTFKQYENQYAGWWYCCLPVKRIKEIGYPLPLFMKSDDMEYGIRNGKEILVMNGIGVWHEVFIKKMTPVVRYYSDRNSFILNHYAHGCGLGTLVTAIVGRIYKRILNKDLRAIGILALALRDYLAGPEEIISIPADEKLENVTAAVTAPLRSVMFLGLIRDFAKTALSYGQHDRAYKAFRDEKLKDEKFWKQYLQPR